MLRHTQQNANEVKIGESSEFSDQGKVPFTICARQVFVHEVPTYHGDEVDRRGARFLGQDTVCEVGKVPRYPWCLILLLLPFTLPSLK